MTTPANTFLPATDPATGLFFLHRPAQREARGLVVLLHGVGGNEENLAALAPQFGDDIEVLLPRGPLALGPSQFAWFQVSFTAQGPRIDAEQAEAARLLLLSFLASQQAVRGVSPARSIVAGFSQGGIMSASVALTAPGSVAAFAILSGRILPELAPRLAPRAALARLQALVSHGSQDNTLPASWADRAEAWLSELGVPTTARRYPAAHSVTPAMAEDFVRWAQVCLQAPGAQLALDAGTLTLREKQGQAATLALGPEAIARRFFRSALPAPHELEAAIDVIEDALQGIAGNFSARTLNASAASLGALPAFAGAHGTLLSRVQVEAAFNRLADLANGRPAALDPLPDEPAFAARLLVLRELMHHLDFHEIRLA